MNARQRRVTRRKLERELDEWVGSSGKSATPPERNRWFWKYTPKRNRVRTRRS